MSSPDPPEDDGYNRDIPDLKKRKLQRACDVCRRRKVRCDGARMPGNRCSQCLAHNLDCSYLDGAGKRGPPKEYVENLERRLRKMERLLKEVRPDIDLEQVMEHDTPSHDHELLGRAGSKTGSGSKFFNGTSSAACRYSRNPTTLDPDDLESSDGEQSDQLTFLDERMKDVHIGYRFFGKSSEVHLIRTTLDLKMGYTGQSANGGLKSLKSHQGKLALLIPHPWEAEKSNKAEAKLEFPDPDLLKELVRLYFKHINLFMPLLHRPTFEANVEDDLHHRNEGFAGVLLLVCACASRFSNDPRVILPGTEEWHSSGWRWFKQVSLSPKSFLSSPGLYDLQKYSLGCAFLQGCSSPQACWTLSGFGIRVAQDVGAHRRKVYSATPTVTDELWKRAFWTLYIRDRAYSAAFGRPCAIQEEDFDLDLPIDCDDEYWTHSDPAQAFKQPVGKPSKASYFIANIKLHQIQGTILRTIYSINKSKALLGFVGPDWEQHIVAELDSALNQWVDSIPDHIKWDPARENLLFFLQSACLFSNYYQVQIMVHRPFIPSPNKPSPLSFPSLAICTNAARSCSHIVGHASWRIPGQFIPDMHIPAFTSSAVILLSIWGARHSGLSIDPAREMEDVHKCMKLLKDAGARWYVPGYLCDIVYDLASVGDLPLRRVTSSRQKRTREEDNYPSASFSATQLSTNPLTSNAFVGLPPSINIPSPKSDNVFAGTDSGSGRQPQAYEIFPMHSDELGRLPTHPNSVPMDSSWFPQGPSGQTQSAQINPGQPFAYHGGIFDPQVLGCFDSDCNGPDGVGGNMTSVTNGSNGAKGIGATPDFYDTFMQPISTSSGPGVGVGASVTANPIDVWANLPNGLDDWDSYLMSMSRLAQPPVQQHPMDNRE